MGTTRKDKEYVAKIEVDGTGIKEYYKFEEPLEEDEVKQIWLDDIRDNKSIGIRLAKKFADRVEVTRLWMETTRSARQEEEKETGQARLPPVEGEDDEEMSM